MEWVFEQAQELGLVPCCGQDVYRVQIPQHPIDSHRYISIYFRNSLNIRLLIYLSRKTGPLPISR